MSRWSQKRSTGPTTRLDCPSYETTTDIFDQDREVKVHRPAVDCESGRGGRFRRLPAEFWCDDVAYVVEDLFVVATMELVRQFGS